MPAPTNISAATATVLGSLPSITDQELAFGGTVYTTWYKLTAVLGQLAISVTAENSNPGGSNYVPDITLYQSDGVTEITVPNTLVPMQIGALVAQDYYIKVSPAVSDITTSPLRLTVAKNPSAPIFASYVLINDDGQSGWNTQGKLPGVIINPATGEVVNIVFPLAQGDFGDILASGIICLEDFATDDLKFYAADFDLITTVDLSASTDFLKIRANNTLNRFAVSHRQGGVTKFKIYSDVGVLLSNDDTALAANTQAIALSNDGLTMYYARKDVGGDPIRLWDLVGNADAGQFAAVIGNYDISDILIMNNGDIIALYVLDDPIFVKRYNSAGVLQATYNIGNTIYPNGANPRLGYDANASQTSFVVWWFPSAGLAQADFIRISDGVILDTFQSLTFEEGVGDGATVGDFGPSNSCPIIVLGTNNEFSTPGTSNADGTLFIAAAAAPPNAASGIYEMIRGKTNDTIWIDVDAGTNQVVKIP